MKRKIERRRRRRKRDLRAKHRIPDDIAKNADLEKAISTLPSNYTFEIRKTLWKMRQAKATIVALQFPEGLLMYACIISDILEHFGGVETIVMGDVTYGACCVDDLTAKALGCDFLVHYGHSCLIPIDVTSGSGEDGEKMIVMYVFVEIGIDADHLARTIAHNFDSAKRLAMLGTIQFVDGVHRAARSLTDHFKVPPYVPQAKPLSGGETLGCTAPILSESETDAFVFVADGRFHLESAMIHNPSIQAYLYNPYAQTLTRERYETEKMKRIRGDAVRRASNAKRFGIILGTLGRQGSPAILDRVKRTMRSRGLSHFVVLMSEIFPSKLQRFDESKTFEVDAWVQIACPRLSVDWGHHFDKPLLSAFEFECAVGGASFPGKSDRYPMDYYAKDGGPWSNYKAREIVSQRAAGCCTKNAEGDRTDRGRCCGGGA